MPTNFKAFAVRSRYRWISLTLLSFGYLAIASTKIGFSAWLVFIIAIYAWTVLLIIIYHRLRDAGLSSWWLLFMILNFGIGPDWHLSENVTFNVGGSIISLVPMILGWIVPAKTNKELEPDSA